MATQYTVIKGDNLTKIAQANNTTVNELLRLNPSITNRNLIQIGQKITLPGGGDGGDGGGTGSYTVVGGDTLQSIAERVLGDASRWREIFDANRDVIGSNPDLIRPGQIFVIPGAGGDVEDGGAGGGGDEALLPPPAPIPPPVSPPLVPPIPDIPDEVIPDTIDFRARAQALFPWLPPALLDIFADAWARTGDTDLALAITRADSSYDAFFPGIKRDDGSLRLSEAEYLARIDGFKLALTQFNLNPANFSGQFAQMIEGELTAGQFASRLSAAFDQIITSMPEIREFYAENFGIAMTDEAIFASFLDPDLGDAIINRRISQAQIGGAGAAAGFTIDLAFSEQLRQQGVGLSQAQTFFGDAALQVPVLSRLALRFGLDKTFDITEFAAGTVLGDPAERRRQRRLFGAETSSFTERLGTVRTEENLAISGLTPR